MKWVGHVVLIGERRGACTVLVGWPEVRRQFGIHKNRWEGNITVDLQDTGMGGGGLEWLRIGHVWRVVVRTAMNLWVSLWLVELLTYAEWLHPIEFVYVVFLLYTWHNNHFMHDLALIYFSDQFLWCCYCSPLHQEVKIIFLFLCWYCISLYITHCPICHGTCTVLMLLCFSSVFSNGTCSIGFGECEHSCVDVLCSIEHQPWLVLLWEFSGM